MRNERAERISGERMSGDMGNRGSGRGGGSDRKRGSLSERTISSRTGSNSSELQKYLEVRTFGATPQSVMYSPLSGRQIVFSSETFQITE